MPYNKRLKFIEDWEFGEGDFPRINGGRAISLELMGGGAISLKGGGIHSEFAPGGARSLWHRAKSVTREKVNKAVFS